MARPVGEGKYAIINYSNNHTELAFVLELPKELGEAQKDLGIEKEASYIVTVINPKIPKREKYLPTTEDAPKYPESVLKDFNDNKEFCTPIKKPKIHRLSGRTKNINWRKRR